MKEDLEARKGPFKIHFKLYYRQQKQMVKAIKGLCLYQEPIIVCFFLQFKSIHRYELRGCSWCFMSDRPSIKKKGECHYSSCCWYYSILQIVVILWMLWCCILGESEESKPRQSGHIWGQYGPWFGNHKEIMQFRTYLNIDLRSKVHGPWL